MSGEELVRHVRLLGAPGAEKLVGEAYDWLFLKAKNDPLATFLQWFMKNVAPNNVLTEREIDEYEALKAQGEVMSATQLQDMEVALSSLPSLPSAAPQCQDEPLPALEDIKTLQDELELLTQRKNMLNAHKLELIGETHRLSQCRQRSEGELQRVKEAVSGTSYHLAKAQKDIASTVDRHLAEFGCIEKEVPRGQEARLLLEVDLEEWHQEEQQCTQLLTQYIERQFPEGVAVMAGTEDASQYVLLDIDKLDLSLVRGAGQEQYQRNIAELRRLSQLLPQTEEWRLSGLITQERRKAELVEGERMLASLHQDRLSSHPDVLRELTQKAKESLAVVERETRQQQQTIKGVLDEVAQMERSKALSGDYELKLQRQSYYLSKQLIVLEQLVAQAARHNWVMVALQSEGEKIGKTLEVLGMVNTRIVERDASYRDRMVQLEAIEKKSEQDKATGVLPKPLTTLACLLPPAGHGRAAAGKEELVKQVEELLTGLRKAEEQVSAIMSPQFSHLSQMRSVCEAFEVCLFGSEGSLQPLPLAWLEGDLSQSCTAVEHKVWEFKKKLLNIISQYEEKRKVLQAHPTVRQDFRKWTTDVAKLL